MCAGSIAADLRGRWCPRSYGSRLPAVYQWGTSGAAMAVLFFGGMLIFPLAQLVLRLMGRPASLPKGHPMTGLAMQIAFTVPLGLPGRDRARVPKPRGSIPRA